MFGFLSFGISELPPMRDFGILAVIGIVASFILVVTLMPALTVLRDRRSTKVVAPQKTGKDASLVGKALARVVTVTLHHRRPVLGIVALLSLCSLVALPQVETTINWEDMMPDNLPSMETAERIGEIFGTASGGGNLLISVEGDLFDPATIGKVLALETELRAITGVNAEGTPLIASPYAVQSYADVLIQANNGNVPSSRLQIATLVEMLLGSPDSAQLIASTVVLDPSSAYYQTLGLISIQANALSEGDIDYIVTAVRDVGQDRRVPASTTAWPAALPSSQTSSAALRLRRHAPRCWRSSSVLPWWRSSSARPSTVRWRSFPWLSPSCGSSLCSGRWDGRLTSSR